LACSATCGFVHVHVCQNDRLILLSLRLEVLVFGPGLNRDSAVPQVAEQANQNLVLQSDTSFNQTLSI